MMLLTLNLLKPLLLYYYRYQHRKAEEKLDSVENDEVLEEQYRNEAARWKNKILKMEK
jgi:hypothetical protein